YADLQVDVRHRCADGSAGLVAILTGPHVVVGGSCEVPGGQCGTGWSRRSQRLLRQSPLWSEECVLCGYQRVAAPLFGWPCRGGAGYRQEFPGGERVTVGGAARRDRVPGE